MRPDAQLGVMFLPMKAKRLNLLCCTCFVKNRAQAQLMGSCKPARNTPGPTVSKAYRSKVLKYGVFRVAISGIVEMVCRCLTFGYLDLQG